MTTLGLETKQLARAEQLLRQTDSKLYAAAETG
jgi:hypothetical protein